MKKLRAAVIGVGYLGRFHVQKYAKIKDVKLAAIVDINEDNLKNIKKDVDVPCYTNYEEILDKIDIASIVVPTCSHFEISKRCLENNIDVLIEKPVTTNIEEIDELIKTAKKNNKIIQVGHLERFNPAIAAIKDAVEKPKFIESHRLGVYKGRGFDVSVILDLMIHDIDCILSFVKSEIKDIKATGAPIISPYIDIANARIEFENGCIANMTASRISDKDERKLRLFQPNAYISVDFANRFVKMYQAACDVSKISISNIKKKELKFEGDALEDEIKDFVRCAITRNEPLVSAMDGKKALSVALEVIKQIENS